MNTAIADESIPDIQTQPRAIIRRQVQELFDSVDQFLEFHRRVFVFREPTPTQLEQHKAAVKTVIRYCRFINRLIAEPDFYQSDLTARLQVRIRQLQDAYDTFHDASLSDEEAGKILKEVFPE